MTCTAARNWASWAMKSTAIPKSVITRLRAQWIGFDRSTTPSAPTSTIVRGDDEHRGVHQPSPASSEGRILRRLGSADAVTELSRPGHAALEVRIARRRRRPHPRRGVEVVPLAPVFPRQLLGLAVVADEQLVLRVDRIAAVRERELEELRLGDRLRGARLDAQVAVDAPQVVDLVDVSVALTRRDRVVDRVVGAADVDAASGAHTGAELASDALLHAVLVAIEDMSTVKALGLRDLVLRVLGRHPLLEERLERDREALEVAHQPAVPIRRSPRPRGGCASRPRSPQRAAPSTAAPTANPQTAASPTFQS